MGFKISRFTVLLIFCFALFSCKKDDPDPKISWVGSGVETYDASAAGIAEPMRIFYYSPSGASSSTPIVFIFHGVDRNAIDYRNAIESKAISKGFIAVVPEFSEQNFPGVSAYQIGNVYQDGDNPSPQTLNPPERWSISLMEPLLDFVRRKSGATNGACYLIGHSAGAQYLHRLLLFKPDFPFSKAVVSAAGWYTIPDTAVSFPFGFGGSPFQINPLSTVYSRKVFVQVGNDDNNPNASNLRRDPMSDQQGIHRLARAQYFFNKNQLTAQTQSMNFSWELKIINGLNHSYSPALQSAADLLFP